jgi:hypothetical protein
MIEPSLDYYLPTRSFSAMSPAAEDQTVPGNSLPAITIDEGNYKWLHHHCLILNEIIFHHHVRNDVCLIFPPRREPIHMRHRSRSATLTGAHRRFLDCCAPRDESPVRELQTTDTDNSVSECFGRML